MFNNIVEAVTNLKREDGSRLIPIKVYFQDRITKLGREFKYPIPDVGRGLGLCPLHDDVKASFGILNGKDGLERYNCFGCQSFGHIVDLHRRVEGRWKSRKISPYDAAYELLDMYGVDKDSINVLIGTHGKIEHDETKESRRAQQAKEIEDSFTDEDYRKAVLEGIGSDKPISYFNTLMHAVTVGLIDE